MKQNPFLVAMTIVGALGAVIGTFLIIEGYNAVRQLILEASVQIAVGIGLGVFGLLLLVIAWTVAAARWRP